MAQRFHMLSFDTLAAADFPIADAHTVAKKRKNEYT